MIQLDLVVSRRGVDPAALTCEEALQSLLRLDVERVERALLWRFSIEAVGSEDVRAAIVRAAMRAGRDVNANRDRWTWADEEAAPESAGCVADVWVCDDDGRDLASLAYYGDVLGPRLVDLRRGVRWRIYFGTGSWEAALALTQEITTARSRRQGLLMNPQAQTAEILSVTGPGQGEAR